MSDQQNLTGDILCMGGINMDLVMFMARMPEPGETVVTDNFNTYPGGKGGNQAVTAARLGGRVRFFGKLAEDSFSLQLVNALDTSGVDTNTILRDTSSTAGIAMIRVDATGQNSISFTPGANALLTPAEVRSHSDLFRQGAILLITMEVATETVYAAVRMAHEHGMFVILDPAPPPGQPFPDDLPGCVDIIKPNESEAKLITGVTVTDFDSAETAVSALRQMGFAAPVVTLGEQGAVAWVDGQTVRMPAMRVDTIDSTAAGDVYSGALAAALGRGSGLLDALRFAGAAAALSTTQRGAQTSIPARESVEALVRSL